MKAITSFDQLLEVVREEKPKAGFAAICSNPPYQISVEGNSRSLAIYHHFAKVSQAITERFVSMVYPIRWMSGGFGEGLDEFRIQELESLKYRKFYDYPSSTSLFESVGITGGLNIFLWDSKKSSGNIEYFYNDQKDERKTLGENVIRDPRISKIFKSKITTSISIEKDVFSRYYTDLVKGTKDVQKILHNLSEDSLKVVYIEPGKGVKRGFVPKNLFNCKTSDFKVWVSSTANRVSGRAYPRADRIFVGVPNEICSSTFLKVGSFHTEDEASNCLLYLKTDFSNFLLAVMTPTADAPPRNYALIPNVDFATGEILDKPGTFLDFSKPETLDDQLARIYNLTEDERNLMTKDLKPWKDKTSVTADM